MGLKEQQRCFSAAHGKKKTFDGFGGKKL